MEKLRNVYILRSIQDALLSSEEKQENIIFFGAKLNPMFPNQTSDSSSNGFLNKW